MRSIIRMELAIFVLNLVADTQHRGVISDAVRKACIEERDQLHIKCSEARFVESQAVARGRAQ